MASAFRIELRPFSQLEMSERGIEGTDVAIAVCVDGQVIAWTDDYGTATVIPNTLDGQQIKPLVEAFVESATELYIGVTGFQKVDPAPPPPLTAHGEFLRRWHSGETGGGR